jgi:hypothetical protein
LRLPGRWVSTLPAKALVSALVRPSVSALAAMRAVVAEEAFRVPAWARALPARLLAVLLASLSRNTEDAVRVTFGPEDSCFLVMRILRRGERNAAGLPLRPAAASR